MNDISKLKEQYAHDAQIYENPWVLWEFRYGIGQKWSQAHAEPSWVINHEYRRKIYPSYIEALEAIAEAKEIKPKLQPQPHPHHNLKLQYEHDAKFVKRPWELWEYINGRGEWEQLRHPPKWNVLDEYRRNQNKATQYILNKERFDPHAELRLQYERDRKTHKRPWKFWQCQNDDGSWVDMVCEPSWVESDIYRRVYDDESGLKLPTHETKDVTDPLAYQVGGSHYNSMKIQPVQYIVANDIPYREANVIKYVSRHRTKNGIEDLKKARQYIDMLIHEYENKNN